MNTSDPKTVEIGPEWNACMKLPVTVYVRAQRPGETHVSTREGITPLKPDDLIMRGVEGEEYPIGREIFDRTYKLQRLSDVCETSDKPLFDLEIYLKERRALTDDELDKLRQPRLNFVTLREFRIIARAVEQAHGIYHTGEF